MTTTVSTFPAPGPVISGAIVPGRIALAPTVSGGRDERPWSEIARLRVTDRLVRALDLTDEQVEEIREAMDQYQTDAQEVWEDVLPVLAAQRDSLNAEFERILTPEQYERFTGYLRADRERWLPDRRSRGRSRR